MFAWILHHHRGEGEEDTVAYPVVGGTSVPQLPLVRFSLDFREEFHWEIGLTNFSFDEEIQEILISNRDRYDGLRVYYPAYFTNSLGIESSNRAGSKNFIPCLTKHSQIFSINRITLRHHSIIILLK